MKLKKFAEYIYIVIFFLISLAPACLFVFVRVSESKDPDAARSEVNIEKGVNVEFPSVISEDGINESFDDECETWINQNLPYRDVMLSNINMVLSDVLLIPTSNVIIGLDDWIYSNETLDNYLDTDALSESELRSIGITLSLIEERVEANGGTFSFVPVPNKNTIYPEYMTVRYLHATENDLTRLCDVLNETGVNYADLVAELSGAKESSPDTRLFYRRDTHWTVFGALVGYDSIMRSLGKTANTYVSDGYTSSFSRQSDLDKLLYPNETRFDEEFTIPEQLDYESFVFITPSDVTDTRAQLENFMSDREDHDNNFTTMKRTPEDSSSLYMIRDSFGRALLPYMIDSFAEATFVRSTTPSIENSLAYSDVVYEICERNLKNLIGSAPFMYAPERKELNGTKGVSYDSDLNICCYFDEGYAYRVYGILDRKMIGEDGRIRVRLSGEGEESFTFEAFPILEESLLLENLDESGRSVFVSNRDDVAGFSLYIDRNVTGQGEFSISVLSGGYESEVRACVKESDGTLEASLNPAAFAENPYGDENTGHQLLYRGTSIGIGDNINSLKAGLGAQAAPPEIIVSCLSGNEAVVYYYPNITIEAEMDGTIYYISLMENSYAGGEADAVTEGGLTLGSDNMKIFEHFGPPARERARNCTYLTEHISVIYTYKNGQINSITLEDRKYLGDEPEEAENSSGVKYENGVAHFYDDSNLMQTGWQIIDGEYFFFDRLTGERIVGQVVDGITIGEEGEVTPSDYEKEKIATMMKAHQIVIENTNPCDTMEEKRKKVFDWVLSFPYLRGMRVRNYMHDEGVELLFANYFFDERIGDCVSESAALAFLFHEIGYNNVYWVHDTGHSWVRSDDRLYDPVFAEGRNYDENYDAEFTDYRRMMTYSMLIY